MLTGARPKPSGRPDAIRLDKWLWQARFCKTRGAATRLIADGGVRVNSERVVKPAALVRIGDGLTIRLGDRVRVLRIRALGVRRGPAPEAQGLYDDLTTPPAPLAPDDPADT
jgi:ribosome-associated heat shock protein Hsp15